MDEIQDQPAALNPSNENAPLPLPAEYHSYISEKVLDKQVNVLKFWEVSKDKYPLLSKLAKRVLAIPASSGSVERLFSIFSSTELQPLKEAEMKIIKA